MCLSRMSAANPGGRRRGTGRVGHREHRGAIDWGVVVTPRSWQERTLHHPQIKSLFAVFAVFPVFSVAGRSLSSAASTHAVALP